MAQKTPTLFDEPLPWEADSSSLFAEIAFNLPLRITFAYAVPESMKDKVLPGKRMKAPFGKGNRPNLGYCVAITQSTPSSTRVKSIIEIVDDEPLLSPAMLELTRWIADYYFCGWGQVLEAVIPRGVKDKSGSRWKTVYNLAPTAGPATILPTKQRQAYEALYHLNKPATAEEIARAGRVSPAIVRVLLKRGWLQASQRKVDRIADSPSPLPRVKPLRLNPDQAKALDSIIEHVANGTHRTFLLHGVTGSGKTEVYLQAIDKAVERGRQAIVLVPEISLTPQTIERFRGRFDHVAVLHSHLSDVERHQHWKRIRQGEVQVVVGARSAIFAPCPNLGLIVIDEEHEHTFKQETAPRYHARAVAIQRGQRERIPVVLGSATPAMESWHAAQTGGFTLLSMPSRVEGLTIPKVAAVDLRSERRAKTGFRSISDLLARAMDECLRLKGQIILLLNRRGFAPAILCPQCGAIVKCPHCDIALTFHKTRGSAICHSCDAIRNVPRHCEQCKSGELLYLGQGTQRLEDEIRGRFPDARCERMDSDTMKSAEHYERVLSNFRAGKIDILLGTQMIAKGLDFPNVRLVGVISADTARNIPDFRAAERTFQLILQVAGRTGRGAEIGKVLVQTHNPDDLTLKAAIRGDYVGFAHQELATRRSYAYPPYALLTRIIIRGKEEKAAREGSQEIGQRLALHRTAATRILGPAPAPVTKLRDYFRFHLQIHSQDADARRQLLEAAFDRYTPSKGVEFVIDVDPLELL